jgi:hypothetical protein
MSRVGRCDVVSLYKEKDLTVNQNIGESNDIMACGPARIAAGKTYQKVSVMFRVERNQQHSQLENTNLRPESTGDGFQGRPRTWCEIYGRFDRAEGGPAGKFACF